MKKNKKVPLNRFIVFSVSLIAVISVLTVSWAVRAAVSLEKTINIENVETLTINIPEPTVDIEADIELGGAFTEQSSTTATSTTDVQQVFGISVFDTFRWGDNPIIDARSETTHYVQKSFTTASSTWFKIQIQESTGDEENARAYIEGLSIKFTGMPTNTIQMFLGTSSNEFLNLDTLTGLGNVAAASVCSLIDDLTITDGGVLDATNTVVFAPSTDYEPCTVGYGTDIRNVPLIPGEWLVGVATGTTGNGAFFDNGSDGNRLDGWVYIKYRIVK